jgi:hypothetical protein
VGHVFLRGQLRKLKLTRLQPRPFHPKRDEAAQEAFKKRARTGGPPVVVEAGRTMLDPRGAAEKFFGGFDPVKKRGAWVVADLRVVTLSGDPV